MKQHISPLLLVVLLALILPSLAQDIRMPPSITKGPPRYIGFTTGQKVTLPCIAEGIPEPEFEWFHNGALMDKNKPGIVWNKGSMTIQETTANFEGEWQCFAKNMHGKSMSAFSKLQQYTMSFYPPGQSEQVKTYSANAGDMLKLTCDNLKSVPEATYSWSSVEDEDDDSPGEPIQITERIQIDDDGHLYFANVVPADHLDGALYKCTLYNSALIVSVGGSLSKINVNPADEGSPDIRNPTLEYSTESPVTGLRTRIISMKCLFAGNPSPKVRWSKVGGSLPFGRHTVKNSGTTLEISNLVDEDQGEYECTGINSSKESKHTLQLVVDSEPVFVTDADRPMNDNSTVGDTVEFKCHADAKPAADVTWYINGDEITVGNEGPRRSISDNGLKLTIENLCKDCTGEGDHKSDLLNVQCIARNKHNYTFADAYLNVLERTTLTVVPEDQELEYGSDVIFKCGAVTDDSTPLSFQWQKNNYDIELVDGRIEVMDDHSLKLITENDDDEGASFEGEYTCIATNGYSTEKASAYLTLPEGPLPVKGASMADLWWVFLIIALILLLLILICCCCLCMQRNKGDSYPVDEKERAQGNDPEKELENDGYHDYQRPEDQPIKGSRASLTSTIKLDSDDEGSLNEYGGDLDTGKFNEDGSFIGQYIEKDKKRPKDSEV